MWILNKKNICELFVTVGRVGHIGRMPGTFGALVGLLLGWPLLHLSGFEQAVVIVVVSVLAILACQRYESFTQSHDSSRIVIDEVVGMWVAIWGLAPNVLSLVVAFVFFRLFDISKPFPVGWADKQVR